MEAVARPQPQKYGRGKGRPPSPNPTLMWSVYIGTKEQNLTKEDIISIVQSGLRERGHTFTKVSARQMRG